MPYFEKIFNTFENKSYFDLKALSVSRSKQTIKTIMKMQNSKTSIYIMFISFLLCAACSSDVNLKVNANSDNKILKGKIELGNFEYGTWRIDSVSENNIVIDRLTNKSVIQVFNFRKNGVFSTMEVTPSVTKDQVIGKWKVEKDSVFILGEKGNIAMRYTYEINESTLFLNGNFNVSSNTQKKPSFYLSKYLE